MEEKKRKSSRSFELEKGGKRSFDLNKTSARKFDLAKESDEVSLEELKKELLTDGKIDAEEVAKLREVLYADGKIDQEEADFLFELNDAVSGKPNDSSWNQFFVEAISDYLLNDEKSPGVIDEEEGRWLEEKINNDGKLDTVERALVASLRRKSKSMPQSLNAILSQVASRFKLEKDEVPAAEAAVAAKALSETKAKASRFDTKKEDNDTDLVLLKKGLLADGIIDKEEVELLRKTLYADGKIDQKEADFIFEINDAVSGKNNDPAWNQFFVQAISDFLLNDEKSPGVIDEEEGKWLVEKIGADGQVDGVEKELLINLKKKAKSMPSSVLSLIGSDNNRPKHPTPEDDVSDGKSPKWKWLIPAAIVAVAVPSYFLFTGNDDTSSTKDQIVASAPEAGQTNAGDDAAESNGLAGESDNSDNVTNPGGSGDVDNTGGSGDSNGSNNSGIGDNPSETGNARNISSPESGNVRNASLGSENIGTISSGAKVSTPQSSVVQSSPNNKATSVSSTASAGSNSVKEGKTETSSRQGTSESGNSKNSGTSGNLVISGSIEQKAFDVIRGIYGNGQVRKDKLGAEYAEIQKLVNEMYRNGKVKR